MILDERQEDGSTWRAHLEQAARRGSETARARLEDGPPLPLEVGYLLEWASMLSGRSGAHMGGLAPLSWPTLDAWMRVTGERPSAAEVRALLELDAVLRRAGKQEDPQDDEETAGETAAPDPWPTKKTGGADG